MKNRIRRFLLAAGAILLLSGCQRTSKEQLALREDGILAMESGDFAGAVAKFDEAVAESKKIGEFETDVLKYRAEAEFLLKDFVAAAHTYGILIGEDENVPEYHYFRGLCLAEGGDPYAAAEEIRTAGELDEEGTAAGYAEAMAGLYKAWLAMGETGQADAVFSELSLSGRGMASDYVQTACAAMEAEEYERAMESIEAGLLLADGEPARKELKFCEAVCQEYLGEYETALELFLAYEREFGSSEAVSHEIAFLKTR